MTACRVFFSRSWIFNRNQLYSKINYRSDHSILQTRILKHTLASTEAHSDNILSQESLKEKYEISGLDLSFENAQEAFRSKTTSELFRALFVFKLCSINVLVNKNKQLLKWSRSILGQTLFSKLMRSTFYGHFVAGADNEEIKPIIHRNMQFGVKSILDYSVEKDISTEEAKQAEMDSCISALESDKEQDNRIEGGRFKAHKEFGDRRQDVYEARTYIYEDEHQCDENMNIFMDSIDAVSGSSNKTGFAAIKLTALGRPQLLLHFSEVLTQMKIYFDRLSSDEVDIVLRRIRKETLESGLQNMGVPISRDHTHHWFSWLDTQQGEIDLFEWSNLMKYSSKVPQMLMVPNLKTGKLESLVNTLAQEEEEQLKNMISRINKLAEYAVKKDVRIMVDAEQTYFQPAISRLTIELMRKFNKEKAVVFNTYQCYLKEAYDNIVIDLDLAKRENFYFGAKLVRGAYMDQERKRAEMVGYKDPINPTYEATSDMYGKVMMEVMKQITERQKGKIAIMMATHNENTVRMAVKGMNQHGIYPSDRLICFGQLLGMCDQVSFSLGQAGYSVYKYVPFGPINEVLPYLSRRAQENKGILKKVKKERRLLAQEIKRRVFHGQLFYKPEQNLPVQQ